jgi:hypothetical protein
MEFDMEGNHATVKRMAEISKPLQTKSSCIEEAPGNHYAEPHAGHQEPSFASSNNDDRDDYKDNMPAPELDFGAHDYSFV